jgi:hypothetical protein
MMSKVLRHSDNGDISTIEVEDSNGDKYIIVFVGKNSNLNPKPDSVCLCLINEGYPTFKVPNFDIKDQFELWNASLSGNYPYENKVFTIHVPDTEEEDK